jgi:hypothetical protein
MPWVYPSYLAIYLGLFPEKPGEWTRRIDVVLENVMLDGWLDDYAMDDDLSAPRLVA